jgi:hypothetical protein
MTKSGRAHLPQRYDITAPIGLVPHPRLGMTHGATAGDSPDVSAERRRESWYR